MKISYNWLKNYLQTSLDAKTLSLLLTESGLEVEGMETIESVKGGLKGVFTAQVLTCEKHPDSDHLSLTTVDAGQGEPLSVVCGAPNVATGQKVLLATVGTTLYFKEEPLVIKKAKIRGAVSEGMICAEDELGLGKSHEGIMVLDPSVPVGIPAAEFLGLKEDTVFEIGLTPNRTDATSHIGVARDLYASIRTRMPQEIIGFVKPDVSGFHTHNHDLNIEVSVENPEACIRYTGLSLTDVNVKESPAWLKEALLAVGIRPINNIVDITNYVLMETGQPLHAFDAAKIEGNQVIIKILAAGTPFITLDGQTRELADSDLMICNAREGMCIAGVFGGLHSGVEEHTTSVFLESACFSSSYVRKTSRRHMLYTDASFRFERGSDPGITVYAIQRAALLMCEIAGAKVSSDIKDIYPVPVAPAQVVLRYRQMKRLIGKNIEPEKAKQILELLEYKVTDAGDDFLLAGVPSCRVDVTREADVIEDILRIYGYNNVEFSEELHTSLSYSPGISPEKIKWEVAGMLAAMGCHEVMNNSLSHTRHYSHWDDDRKATLVHIANPLSRDLEIMRADLIPGLLENIAFNQNRKITDLKLFEFGKTYHFDPSCPNDANVVQRYPEKSMLAIAVSGKRVPENWEKVSKNADFFYAHALLQNTLRKVGIPLHTLKYNETEGDFISQGLQILVKKDLIASIGRISQKRLAFYDIRQEVSVAILDWDKALGYCQKNSVVFHELPRYPEVRRDLALLLDKNIRFSEIERLAYQTEGKLLKHVGLFDIYEGEKTGPDKKSYALSFILQDPEKTLNDEMIEKVMQRLAEAFTSKLGARIRS